MDFQKHKFSRENDTEFFITLKKRVDDYFKTNNISKHWNANMVLKSIFMFSLYFIPYIIILSGTVTNPWLFYSLWVVMGLGMAGIGLNIMHDANHGAYSSNSTVNKYLGLSMNLIGANAKIWKLQHNVLHHAYTNIEGADDDIHSPSFLRFSPHQEKRWVHRFQHLYIWFLYGLSTITWVTGKEFGQLVRYRKMGLIKSQEEFRKDLQQLIIWKVLYYIYILVIPLMIVPVAPWLIIVSFLSMHIITSLILSLIFQPAHIILDTEFPLPEKDGRIANNWAVHQLVTTTNFAPNSVVFSWLVGGLNYQVEHHLFSNVCHVHYRKISKIVRETAQQYGLPYHQQKTFLTAIVNHARMLKKLGRA